MRNLFFLLLLIIATSCGKSDDNIAPPAPSVLSKITIENGQFENANGDPFFPWGFNYTNAEGVVLIEDNWLNEDVWQTIKSDFAEMSALGANVVRIHLQYNEFMTDATTPNTQALDRLEDLLAVAEEDSLYLDITGLSAYRKSDQPSFYREMTDQERWNTQKVFWASVAERVGDSPVVFAYNLMNEPVVSVGCDAGLECDWTPGAGFGGFHFVQNVTRTPGNEFESTLKNWMAEMTETIRSKDNSTLITVGLLSLGPFDRFAADLDYLSPHLYPRSGEIQKSIDKILDNQSGTPTVIEETSNLFCNIGELEEFIDAIDGKYNGLMGHYHGTPFDELNDGTIKHALQKNFLQFFMDKNPN